MFDQEKPVRLRVMFNPSADYLPPRFITAPNQKRVNVDQCWRIVELLDSDATREDAKHRFVGYVCSTRYGKVVTDLNGKLLDGWHVGISAGDLAKAYVSRLRGKRLNQEREPNQEPSEWEF